MIKEIVTLTTHYTINNLCIHNIIIIENKKLILQIKISDIHRISISLLLLLLNKLFLSTHYDFIKIFDVRKKLIFDDLFMYFNVFFLY